MKQGVNAHKMSEPHLSSESNSDLRDEEKYAMFKAPFLQLDHSDLYICKAPLRYSSFKRRSLLLRDPEDVLMGSVSLEWQE